MSSFTPTMVTAIFFFWLSFSNSWIESTALSSIHRPLTPGAGFRLCHQQDLQHSRLTTCSSDDSSIIDSEEGEGGGSTVETGRRRVLKSIILGTLLESTTAVIPSDAARARNLPSSTGVDESKTGTVSTLIPIVRLQQSLLDLQSQLVTDNKSPREINLPSTSIVPREEVTFKRILDAYSDPVSYKQKFVDQNAFLVYYTKGFDGPGRPNIEDDLPVKQSLQYGSRNDAWVAWDDFLVEWDFALKEEEENGKEAANNRDDLLQALQRTLKAFDAYLSLAPTEDLMKARVGL